MLLTHSSILSNCVNHWLSDSRNKESMSTQCTVAGLLSSQKVDCFKIKWNIKYVWDTHQIMGIANGIALDSSTKSFGAILEHLAICQRFMLILQFYDKVSFMYFLEENLSH